MKIPILARILLPLLPFAMISHAAQTAPAHDRSETQATEQIKPGELDSIPIRGVVYDLGLQFTPGSYSVERYNAELVKYDMRTIANELRANTVRIEGEHIARIVKATRVAHAAGLKVFFNPWKMGVGADETIAYLEEAAKEAEKLRQEGVDLVFVAGCEYTLFNKGALPGETFNERMAVMVSNMTRAAQTGEAPPEFVAASKYLNEVLAKVLERVRAQFKGRVTYASGTWETVDWGPFDIVGVDYYRHGEPEDVYIAGLEKYKIGKPVVVMEVGSCAYKGAAARGAGGFMVLQGTNPDGSLKYEGGKPPIRDEEEQATYVEDQVRALSKAKADGVFIYVFAFPIFPYDEKGADLDMTSFALVKSFPQHDPRSKKIPSWEPKASFHRLAKLYQAMKD